MSPGTVVVDASTLVAAVTDATSLGCRAREQLRNRLRAAPFLIDAETGSALRSMVLRGDLDAEVAQWARVLAERMIHRRHPHHGALAARAWQLRHSLSFYDALYLALAESLNCPLITADRRIARAQSKPRLDPDHFGRRLAVHLAEVHLVDGYFSFGPDDRPAVRSLGNPVGQPDTADTTAP